MAATDGPEMESELHRLKDHWRVSPTPPLDAMWTHIEARAFPAGGRVAAVPISPLRRWWPLAAMLVLGFGIGRLVPAASGGGAPNEDALAARQDSMIRLGTLADAGQEPFVGIASGYVEQVTALLVTLANETEQGQPLDNSRSRASELLATTRLLLDSPGRIDPGVAGLLDDLELVLVQIARLPNRPNGPDVYLIDQALDQRDVMPRLRVMLANAQDNRPY
jgi:hypothetical protein